MDGVDHKDGVVCRIHKVQHGLYYTVTVHNSHLSVIGSIKNTNKSRILLGKVQRSHNFLVALQVLCKNACNQRETLTSMSVKLGDPNPPRISKILAGLFLESHQYFKKVATVFKYFMS